MFEDFLKDGLVVKVSPDAALAESRAIISCRRMKILEKMQISDENSFSFVENCYEAIRELIDSIMALRGYKSYSHEASVDFLRAFSVKEMGTANIEKINRYMILRNSIKYRGLLTTKTEARIIYEDSLDIIKALDTIFEKELEQKR